MRRAPATAAALSVLLLAGCGSGSHAGPTMPQAGRETDFERVASLCGTLNARLRGIAALHHIGDPQPATLRGRRPGRRTARASVEAALKSHLLVAPLRAARAPERSIVAVAHAERQFARYADVAKHAFARSGAQGLRIELGYLKIAGAEVAGCVKQVREG